MNQDYLIVSFLFLLYSNVQALKRNQENKKMIEAQHDGLRIYQSVCSVLKTELSKDNKNSPVKTE